MNYNYNITNGVNIYRSMPMPVFILDKEGYIKEYNEKAKNTFGDNLENLDFKSIAKLKIENLEELLERKEGQQEDPYIIEKNERIYELQAFRANFDIIVLLNDITKQVKLEEQNKKDKPCIAIVHIDNYDELQSSKYTDDNMEMISKIDKAIRSWGEQIQASVIRNKEHIYVVIMNSEYCTKEMDKKFPILDEIRSIESGADFPITLSIGIGLNSDNLEEADYHAQQALDLALGRGGDQVVVKDGDRLYYFGGKAKAVEKSNKGKSRMIAHALKQLILSSSNIFIMGHKNPDMDAFGAAMGISRIVKELGKDAYIVLEEYSNALDLLLNKALDSEEHEIITRKKAIRLQDKNSLVVIVDTHKKSITECPELLDKSNRRVVIDHHRKGEDFIENPTLVYMEPYASSTSELVTEIIQYTVDRRDVTHLEADGLLAGILLDTNRFSTQTGVRTFEAAAWLRRAGADLTRVKELFQVEKRLFMNRLQGVSNAVFDGSVAYTICESEGNNTQVLCSIVADELLTMRGINTTFAIGVNQKGKTIISARSIGEINVQVVMEKFGGGGHLNGAGAQTDLPPREVLEMIKDIMEEKDESNIIS